jgi:hypothetical protein
MQAAVERMKREWGPQRSTPAAARGMLEILAVKERSPRCIGNVAKLDCFDLPQTL